MAADESDIIQFKCSESVITCQICMEIFESPRILPCQHTFCKNCVISLIKKNCLDESARVKRAAFPCPNCRRECKIYKKGRQSMDEYLKCFPECLLQKTVLESVAGTRLSATTKGTVDKETEHEATLADAATQHMNEFNHDVYLSADTAHMAHLLVFQYYMFLTKIQHILGFLDKSQHFNYQSSFKTLSRSVLTCLLYELCCIPLGFTLLCCNAQNLTLDIDDVSMLESRIVNELTSFGSYGWHWNNDTEHATKEVETQTDNVSLTSKITKLFEMVLLCTLLPLSEFLIFLPVTWLILSAVAGRFTFITTGVYAYHHHHELFGIDVHNTQLIDICLLLVDICLVGYFCDYTFIYLFISLVTTFVMFLLYFRTVGISPFKRKVTTFVIVDASVIFVSNIYRCASFCYAAMNLFLHFDIWLLCTLMVIEVGEKMLSVCVILMCKHLTTKER